MTFPLASTRSLRSRWSLRLSSRSSARRCRASENPADRRAGAPVSVGVSWFRLSGSVRRASTSPIPTACRAAPSTSTWKRSQNSGVRRSRPVLHAERVLRPGAEPAVLEIEPRPRDGRVGGQLTIGDDPDHPARAELAERVVQLHREVDDEAEHPQQPRVVRNQRRRGRGSRSRVASGDGSTYFVPNAGSKSGRMDPGPVVEAVRLEQRVRRRRTSRITLSRTTVPSGRSLSAELLAWARVHLVPERARVGDHVREPGQRAERRGERVRAIDRR